MADRTIKTVLQITGEGSYQQKLKQIGAALKGISSEEKLLNAQYGASDKSLAKLTQQHALLEGKLKLQQERLEAIRKEYEMTAEAEGETSEHARKLAADYNYASAQATKTEKAVKELAEQLEKSSTAWGKVSTWVDKNNAKLEKIGNTVTKVSGKIAKAGAAMLTSFGGFAGKAFMDFEDSMAIVQTIADTSAVSMEQLSAAALETSSVTGQAATEIAAAAYSAISAGVDTADAIGVVEQAAKAAKAGLSDTETVIDGLTSAMNAWKISYSDAETVLNKMIITQNVGKTTIDQLASSLGNVTGIAPQVGVSLEEILAATAAMTKNGYQTGVSMNALKAVMSAVIKPTSEAAEAAKEMGLQFDAAALRSKGLIGFLEDVAAKTGGSEDKLAKLFGSVEALGGVMLLTGTAADDFNDALSQIGDSAGALNAAFDTRTSSRAEQMAMALNRAKNAAIEFGQTLAPYIDRGASAIEGLAKWMDGLSESQKTALINTVAWTVGISAGLSIVGKLIANIKKIVSAVSLLAKGFKTLSALVGGAGVLAGVASGVAVIGAAVYGLNAYMDSIDPTKRIADAFSGLDIDTGEIDDAVTHAESLRQAMENIQTQKQAFAQSSSTFMGDTVSWLSDGLPETQEQLEEWKTNLAALINEPFEYVKTQYDENKATLDTALAEGVISQEQYDEMLGQLESNTTTLQSDIQSLQDTYVSYVETIVAEGRKPTEEELATLTALRDQIVGINNELLEANNTALMVSRASYSKAKSGRGSADDYAAAVAYAQSERENKEFAAREIHKTQTIELEYKFEAAEKTGDKEAMDAIAAQMEALDTALETQIEAADASYTEMLNELVAGLAEKYPQVAAQLAEITEKQNLYEEALAAMTDDEKLRAAIIKEFGEGFDFSGYTMEGGALNSQALLQMLGWEQMILDLPGEIASLFETAMADPQAVGIFEAFSSMLGSGMLENADLTQAQGAFADMLMAYDYAEDGKTVGEQLITGEVQGIEENQEALNAAIKASAEAGNAVLTGTQGIHSPSTVWAGYGKNLIEGLRNGVLKNSVLINSAMNALASRLKTSGRNSVQGWIDGANSKRSALIAAYRSMASAAINAVNARLEIHSPSKVFERAGIYSAEGMIGGINKRIDSVQAAMRRMVEPPETRAGTTGAAASGAGQTINYITNVNYTGAVTGREGRKLGRIVAQTAATAAAGKGY